MSFRRLIGGGIIAQGLGGLAYSNLVLSHGPFAYYRLDESTAVGTDNIVDASGNGYHLSGPPIASNIVAESTSLLAQGGGTCFDFPGTLSENLRLEFSDNNHPFAPINALGGDGFTFECWLNRGSSASAMGLFAYDATAGDAITCRLMAAADSSRAQFECTAGGTRYSFNGPGGVITDTVTHHLVFTLSPDGSIALWIDGTQRTKASEPDLTVPGIQTLNIAAGGDGSSLMYDGRLDEIAFYEHVLTDAQIAEHYSAGT